MKYFDKHFTKRIWFALIFAFHFIVIGWLIPNFYFHYLDKTDYYTVVQPVSVDQKWYKPCDDVVLTTIRTSVLDFSGNVQTNLLLKQGNNVIFRVPDVNFNRRVSVKKGVKVAVAFSYPLPCSLADGVYYWQVTLDYKVKGFDREYIAVSDTFQVNQYGIDPTVIKIATSAAELEKLQTPRNTNPSFRVLTPTPTTTQVQTPGQTTVIQNNSSPEPTPQPTQEPQPTPPQHLICVLGACL